MEHVVIDSSNKAPIFDLLAANGKLFKFLKISPTLVEVYWCDYRDPSALWQSSMPIHYFEPTRIILTSRFLYVLYPEGTSPNVESPRYALCHILSPMTWTYLHENGKNINLAAANEEHVFVGGKDTGKIIKYTHPVPGLTNDVQLNDGVTVDAVNNHLTDLITGGRMLFKVVKQPYPPFHDLVHWRYENGTSSRWKILPSSHYAGATFRATDRHFFAIYLNGFNNDGSKPVVMRWTTPFQNDGEYVLSSYDDITHFAADGDTMFHASSDGMVFMHRPVTADPSSTSADQLELEKKIFAVVEKNDKSLASLALKVDSLEKRFGELRSDSQTSTNLEKKILESVTDNKLSVGALAAIVEGKVMATLLGNKDSLGTLRTKVENLENQMGGIKTDTSNMNKQTTALEEVSKRLQTLESQNGNFKIQIDEFRKDISKSSASNDKTATALDEITGKLGSLESEVAKLKQEIAKLGEQKKGDDDPVVDPPKSGGGRKGPPQ